MDALLKRALDLLLEEAVKHGSDLIRQGVELVRERVEGRATDRQVLDFLAAIQDAP